MLWAGMGGHRSLLMVMVWVWVQIRRKMLGSAASATKPHKAQRRLLRLRGLLAHAGLPFWVGRGLESLR
jgi:hypothetical protein